MDYRELRRYITDNFSLNEWRNAPGNVLLIVAGLLYTIAWTVLVITTPSPKGAMITMLSFNSLIMCLLLLPSFELPALSPLLMQNSGKDDEGIDECQQGEPPFCHTDNSINTCHEEKKTEHRLPVDIPDWENIFNNFPDAITVQDLEQNIIFSNEAARDLFCLPKDNQGPLKCYQYYHGTDSPPENCRSCACLKSGKTVTYETFEPHLNRYIEIKAVPRYDSNDRIIGLVHISRDIGNIKRVELELKRAIDSAESANCAKNEFLANMSHEIRTPLNAIIGMTELTLETGVTMEQKEYLDTIRESSNSLLMLVNGVLDLSKPASGEKVLKSIEFSLKETVESIMGPYIMDAAGKGLELYCELSNSLEDNLKGDPGCLRKIFSHLLDNAIKFTDKGTIQVTIKEYPLHSRKLREQRGSEKTSICFSVSDTGIGIPSDKLDHIFDIFTQSDGSLSRTYGGAGIGLSIVKQLIDRIKGEIWVESRIGKGSTFHFKLNFETVGTPEQKKNLSRKDIQAAAHTKAHILLAEDNEVNQKLAQRVLQKEGYTVAVANNGEEVLEALRKEVFDIILMDVQMPRMDGIETTKAIRSTRNDEINSKIPIIALTAHALDDDRQQCLKAGMNDYMSKPFQRKKLFTLIDSYTNADKIRSGKKGAVINSKKAVNREMALQMLDGDTELLSQVQKVFIEDAPAQMAALKEAIYSNDRELAEHQAHYFVTASASIGAETMKEHASQIEETAKRNKLGEAQRLYKDLEVKLEEVLRELS